MIHDPVSSMLRALPARSHCRMASAVTSVGKSPTQTLVPTLVPLPWPEERLRLGLG